MDRNFITNKRIFITCGTGSLSCELVHDRERLIHATEDIDIIFQTSILKHEMASEYNPLVVSFSSCKFIQYLFIKM